ncbi:chromatin assembly factor 1 subunit A-like [Benincasa hispida]|uniref:chromatin assembly factor 1 subunit A-like n=1 Tax=Benincasa hispida TaxID=102211 RepID=UPI001900E95C|nr:chromatin assembly factor 1 subunit A-like [Benincasa hispida]
MADQASQPSASPSTPSNDQIAMREAAFLTASLKLAAQPYTILRIAAISTESEKKRCDDTEVFGNILSNLEQGGGLPEVGVVNQPLSMEEVTVAVTEEVVVVEEVVNEEETRRGTLALETPEVTANAETYDRPSRVSVEEIAVAEVAMEEVTVETQLEVVGEKKKKKRKGKKAVEGKSSHHCKEKKNKEKHDDEDEEAKKERKRKEKEEIREHRLEERRLRKEEEKKMRTASLEKDGESTSVREDR